MSHPQDSFDKGDKEIPELQLVRPLLEEDETKDELKSRFPISLSEAHKTGTFFDAQNEKLYLRPSFQKSKVSEFFRCFDSPNELVFCDEAEFNDTLESLYAQSGDHVGDAIRGVSGVSSPVELLAQQAEDLLSKEDEAPIIRLLNAVFFDAIRLNASDIHIEPYEKSLVVRLRVDGMLKEHLTTKATIASLLITRIKVIARLDIAEKRVPQDGRVTLRLGRRGIDLRVSTMPTAYGERVVMRLLDKQKAQMSLESLGMPKATLDRFQNAIAQPNGIVLVTGPTGSGKTTTLYAALERVDRNTLNIMTVEDPLEYYMKGVSQTQVNVRAGLTFARGLRAILRQDPDVVMIGEIRDKETASIAVQASLTGHLVFSTIHTNSALGAITRLKDMEIEPFLLASSVQALLAQRLVRKLCQHCKLAYEPSDNQKLMLQKFVPDLPDAKLYSAHGCKECLGLGYFGRLGVYELVLVDENLRGMIANEVAEGELSKYAFSKVRNLRSEAFAMATLGQTTFEEAARITAVL